MSEPAFDENFFDSADQNLTKDQLKEAKLCRLNELDDIRWVLSHVKGRRFIWRLLSWCGAFRASYVPKDSTQTAFNEGKRDVGLRLLLDVSHANPKAYSQMEDEVLAREGKKKERSS